MQLAQAESLEAVIVPELPSTSVAQPRMGDGPLPIYFERCPALQPSH
jgi:hypothetical protein